MMLVCGTCNKSLKFKSGLYRHNKTQHKGATVSCECGFTFPRYDNMKRHKSSGKCKVPSPNDSSNENISQSYENSELDAKEQHKFGTLNANLTGNTTMLAPLNPSNEDQDTGDDDDSGFSSSSSDFVLVHQRAIKFKLQIYYIFKIQSNSNSNN